MNLNVDFLKKILGLSPDAKVYIGKDVFICFNVMNILPKEFYSLKYVDVFTDDEGEFFPYIYDVDDLVYSFILNEMRVTCTSYGISRSFIPIIIVYGSIMYIFDYVLVISDDGDRNES